MILPAQMPHAKSIVLARLNVILASVSMNTNHLIAQVAERRVLIVNCERGDVRSS